MTLPPRSLLFGIIGALVAGMAAALGMYDGVYGGTTMLVRNNARIGSGEALCAVTATRATWAVEENNVLLTWQGSDWRVPVRPDGTISSSTTLNGIPISASGKVTGPTMVLFFGSQACGYRFDGLKGG